VRKRTSSRKKVERRTRGKQAPAAPLYAAVAPLVPTPGTAQHRHGQLRHHLPLDQQRLRAQLPLAQQAQVQAQAQAQLLATVRYVSLRSALCNRHLDAGSLLGSAAGTGAGTGSGWHALNCSAEAHVYLQQRWLDTRPCVPCSLAVLRLDLGGRWVHIPS